MGPYRWEGDLILQDTVIERKRFVMGSPRKPVRTDLREWLSFADNRVMREILDSLHGREGLPRTRNPGDFDRRARIIWRFVAQGIRYVHDSERQRRPDFWLFPPEVYTLGEGDCEDGSFLLASLLLASGISPFCVRVVLGEVYDEDGTWLGGHCWPVYKDEMGCWCILESTLDRVPSRFPQADRLTQGDQSFRYVPRYCFNNQHLWAILPDASRAGNVGGVQGYLRKRQRKAHMGNTRLPAGGWLSQITGNWEPGHLEVTATVMEQMGFAANALDVAQDASQDPDFYDWGTPWAHAQTENDAEGRTIETGAEASARFVEWIRELAAGVAAKAPRDARGGLFLLGYLLHGIQDLATHQGITNAQHAHLSAMGAGGSDPDHDPVNRARAASYSLRFLEAFRSQQPAAFEALRAYDGRALPWDRLMPWEKERLLKKDGWDLTPAAYLTYRGLAGRYARVKSRFPVEAARWDAEAVLGRILAGLG
jgi:hypothetical protein